MGFFDRKRHSVGLDIGTGWIKLAQIGHGGDLPELQAVAARAVPAEAVVDGRIARPELVAPVVEAALNDAGSSAREVNVALGGHDVFIKRLRIRGPGIEDPAAAARREAERHVPFSLDSVRLDHQILPRDDDPEADCEVLLVAARHEAIESRVAIAGGVGARVGVLDAEALALCNGLVHSYPGVAEGVVGLVDIGHEAVSIVVLVDGFPALIRDLPVGLRRFGELLQQVHGLPAEWAEEVLHGRRDLEGLNNAVETAADVVGVGIERASALLRTRLPGAGLGRMYLSGGGACIAGVAGILGRRMKIETRIANPCERVAIAAGIRGRRLLSQAAPLYLQAIGLALRSG